MSTQTRRESVELDISGMTCASCAARIEKKLNKLDGVTASVNYATEKAKVLYPAPVHVDDLIAVVERTGYGAKLPDPEVEPVDHAGALRRRLIVAAVLGVPVIVLGMVTPLQFPGWQWVSLALTIPIYTWAAWPFHRSALVNLRHGATTMDTLISMGTTAAFGASLVALAGDAGRIGYTHAFEFMLMRGEGAYLYFEAVAAIVVFLLAGRYFEARSRRDAGEAVRALLTLGAPDAALLKDGVETRVGVDQLKVGDRFVVRPGERIATDGRVVEGRSAVDASLVTGESVPVDVGPGDAVAGATVNANGRLVVEATRVGADTQLAQIARMVEEAQTGKAAVQRLADRVSGVFVPVVILIALVTLLFWEFSGAGVGVALTAAVAVLIIACPCALGLATPTALLVGTGRGAQLGIVIKGPEILEDTRLVDTIVLDKTGTLTTGVMSLANVVALPGEEAAEVLALAGAAESGSEHPVARAISAAAGSAPELADGSVRLADFENVPGLGVRADVASLPRAPEPNGEPSAPNGVRPARHVLVGRPALLEQAGVVVPDELRAAMEQQAGHGRTSVAVAWDGRARGVIAVADGLKPTSAEAIARLRELGLKPILLTGDNAAAAESVAGKLGVEEVIAGVLPADKVATIERLQADGSRVAMVGDGVNDAAALAQADLGIALGTGTDAAIQAADLTLMRGDPLLAADAIRLSRATLRTIKANLFWAFAYNVAAIPLAALGFLNPMIASAAMALSSVFVVSNSLRLRGFRSIAATRQAVAE